jgi:hypothetical protein
MRNKVERDKDVRHVPFCSIRSLIGGSGRKFSTALHFCFPRSDGMLAAI